MDNLNTSMQTLLHRDCWRVYVVTAALILPLIVLIWVVPSGGGGKDFVLHHVLFCFFCPVTLSGPRTMVFMSNMSSQLTSGWWCRLSLFRELEVTWWSNESDTSCSLLCSAIVTKPICIRSFVHFSIDPEVVILKYISLGITQLMQTFQKRKMCLSCVGFFFFLCRYVFSVFKFTCHSLLWRKWNKIIANWIHSFRSATVVFIINDDNDICDE